MSPNPHPVPRRVSARTQQRLEALRAAIPPIYAPPEKLLSPTDAIKPVDAAQKIQLEFNLTPENQAMPAAAPETQKGIPWNRGRLVGAKLPLKPKHVWSLRFHLHRANLVRDLAVF